MKTISLWLLVISGLVLIPAAPIMAADQERERAMDQSMDKDEMIERDRDRDRLYNEDTVYGWHMMSDAERNEYRHRMLELRTEQEREKYRIEHHRLMEERAKSRGDRMNDTMRRNDGMGPGGGGGMGGGR